MAVQETMPSHETSHWQHWGVAGSVAQFPEAYLQVHG